MVGKKAQLKIQQMAFMLLAVTLFFVFVGLFFIVITLSGLQETGESLEEKNAMLLVSRLANSPEFSCGSSFSSRDLVSCVDGDKVMALKSNIDKYAGFWGNSISNIEIRRIYPSENGELCDNVNYPDCDIIRIIRDDITGNFDSTFVSLCRKEAFEGEVYGKCELAELMVSYETG